MSNSIHSIELDDLDKQIITKLQQNGKHSLRELSRLTGSSVSAVKNHVDKLQDNGVIKKYTAIVDCCKIGYHEMLVISLRINARVPIEKVFNELKEQKLINFIYHVSGEYPVLLLAKCVSKDQQIDLIERIKRIPGIEEVVTNIVMRRIKEDIMVKVP